MSINYTLLISIAVIVLFGACSSADNEASVQAEPDQENIYGESFNAGTYFTVAELIPLVTQEESETIQVKGQIVEVCQSKGCWLTLANDEDVMVRVTFKDYGFFVPKDIAGREVILEGISWLDTVSVSHQQHYAEDAGADEQSIAAITEPEMSYYFEATGVILL